MVRKFKFAQQSWADEVTAAITLYQVMSGRIEQIKVTINDNTGNRTLTLTITDSDGHTLYTKAGIPENATTIYTANSNKAVQDADFNAILVDDKCSLVLTPSGDPGASGMTVDLSIYVTEARW